MFERGHKRRMRRRNNKRNAKGLFVVVREIDLETVKPSLDNNTTMTSALVLFRFMCIVSHSNGVYDFCQEL